MEMWYQWEARWLTSFSEDTDCLLDMIQTCVQYTLTDDGVLVMEMTDFETKGEC